MVIIAVTTTISTIKTMVTVIEATEWETVQVLQDKACCAKPSTISTAVAKVEGVNSGADSIPNFA